MTEHTALVLAPHPLTCTCDVAGLEELACRYNLPLLFDSVEASGATILGRPTGAFGDAEIFSLHACKLINGAEGGYITTDNDELAALLRLKRAFGFESQDRIVTLGCNAKLNELHAALAMASLLHLDEQIASYHACHRAYARELESVPGLCLVEYPDDSPQTWKSVLVEILDDWPFSRTDTLALLNAEMFYARPYYMLSQEYRTITECDSATVLPVAEWVAARFMVFPHGTTMREEDIAPAVDILRFIQAHAPAIKLRLVEESHS